MEAISRGRRAVSMTVKLTEVGSWRVDRHHTVAPLFAFFLLMNSREALFEDLRTLVIKVGTRVLCEDDNSLSEAQLAQHFSGPAFLPWQRMGNIEGYRAPLPTGWIDKKHALQKRILTRMHELGMTPILPAFAGYVPKAFAEAHPKARIYKMRSWEGFEGTYWLDPSDPLADPAYWTAGQNYQDVYEAARVRMGDSAAQAAVLAHYAKLWKIHSLLTVPIRREGVCIGVLRLGSYKKNFFNQSHADLLTVIAEEAAVLVETAMLNRKLAETAEQLKAYAGDYWSTELGVSYRLGIADGRLKVVALLVLVVDQWLADLKRMKKSLDLLKRKVSSNEQQR